MHEHYLCERDCIMLVLPRRFCRRGLVKGIIGLPRIVSIALSARQFPALAHRLPVVW